MYLKNVSFSMGIEHWHLIGNVHGSDRFPDGRAIKTSGILKAYHDGPVYMFITKNNSYYVLADEFIDPSEMVDEIFKEIKNSKG